MKMLNVKETADLLNVKVSTIYSWVHYKKIPFVKMNGKLLFIETQIIDYVVNKNYVPSFAD